MTIRSLAASACLMLAAATAAQASTVNIGGFSFDESQYATSASVTVGAMATVAQLADGNLGTLAGNYLGIDSASEVQVNFGFDIINGAGFDFLVFEAYGAENTNVALASGGAGFSGALQSTQASQGAGAINIFAYDLSDFGIAAGDSVGSSLFLTAFTTAPDVLEVAALNAAQASSVSAVPLPAGGLLLLTALGGVAALKRRKKRTA